MKTSESITNIIPALLNAQKAMGGATKGANNPYFKSKYADYGSVLEACKEVFNENGILILQPHVFQDGKNFVETLLIHESGEFISSLTEVVCSKQNDPQALGSAITYARRYGLQSLPAMPTEDDDGEGAMKREPRVPKASEAAKVTVSPTVSVKPATVAPVSVSNTTPTVTPVVVVTATPVATIPTEAKVVESTPVAEAPKRGRPSFRRNTEATPATPTPAVAAVTNGTKPAARAGFGK